ncbi:N-acetylglucosamine-6-phosphate deacetylase [Cellulomonas timonensis]|uniref:N-acetylglucosamine-6-phosphate deacetylase n=1 Tax=Cellulomonas timonensis TaxID=1689271 RepID=UPI0011CB5C83|nr:amidohydrolase family protein [Cellulomonas timonensis]
MSTPRGAEPADAQPADAQPADAQPVVVERGQVVSPRGVIADGAVVIDGERIVWVGDAAEAPPRWADAVAATVVVPGRSVLPGLVDLHNHGGGGVGFPDATTVDEARRAAREHLRHGTTSVVASLVTAPRDVLLARTGLLADLVDEGEIIGIHLEGPFLSARRCGAQDPGAMTPGDAGLVREVAVAARGGLATMTVAPEAPGVVDGGDDAVAALVRAGALPSFGHTDASAEQVDAGVVRARALLAGHVGALSARPTATHLFNGMRPPHHRDAGPVAACLAAAARGELVVELVADGVHLDAATVRAVFDLVGPGAVALVTDAMAATGMPDGDYELGALAVRVQGGVARLASPDGVDGDGGGAIAGGTAHLLDVVRATVLGGVRLVDAVLAAATTPAEVLGRPDLGALEAGRRADVLVVDDDLRPVRVRRAGRVVQGVTDSSPARTGPVSTTRTSTTLPASVSQPSPAATGSADQS